MFHCMPHVRPRQRFFGGTLPQPSALGTAAFATAAFAAAALFVAPLWGETTVQYDVGQTVACHDITTAEFLAEHPEERLWEAKVDVSSLIQGDESTLRHYFYQVDAINHHIVFVDYLPRTTVADAYANPVDVEQKREKTNSVGVSVSWDSLVRLGPSASSANKKTTQIRYSLLPPKEQVAASGTRRRSRGVYFKLRRSSQHTLEGAKEFALVFRAPASWRAGAMLLRCQAEGQRKAMFRSERYLAGSGMFMLAMYQAGDEQARGAASEYARAELKLRRAAHQARDAIAKQQRPSSRFLLSDAAPARIPAGWLERLLISPDEANWPDYAEHMPPRVRESGEEFLAAKHQLDGLQ